MNGKTANLLLQVFDNPCVGRTRQAKPRVFNATRGFLFIKNDLGIQGHVVFAPEPEIRHIGKTVKKKDCEGLRRISEKRMLEILYILRLKEVLFVKKRERRNYTPLPYVLPRMVKTNKHQSALIRTNNGTY